MPPVLGPVSPSTGTLVILRCHQRGYALSVAYNQEREFIALQEFFEDYAGSGFA